MTTRTPGTTRPTNAWNHRQQWVAAVITVLPVIGLFVFASQTTGWMSNLAWVVAFASVLGGLGYGVVSEWRFWPAIEEDFDSPGGDR